MTDTVIRAENLGKKFVIGHRDMSENMFREAMMRRAGIRWLSTTTKSIEEIATTILQELRPERLSY